MKSSLLKQHFLYSCGSSPRKPSEAELSEAERAAKQFIEKRARLIKLHRKYVEASTKAGKSPFDTYNYRLHENCTKAEQLLKGIESYRKRFEQK